MFNNHHISYAARSWRNPQKLTSILILVISSSRQILSHQGGFEAVFDSSSYTTISGEGTIYVELLGERHLLSGLFLILSF